MPRLIDLTGRRFGKLTVLERATGYRRPHWHCRCDCGGESNPCSANLLNGQTGSCGCVKRSGLHRTHNLRRTPEYEVWKTMKSRCHNQKSKHYASYGGRSITVCERWRNSFQNFIDDMGRRPIDGRRYTLERKDNNGHYEPNNCVWATYTAQARNKRANRLIEHNGRVQCLSAWAAESPVSPQHFRGRLRDGWTMEEALTAPKSNMKKSKALLARTTSRAQNASPSVGHQEG